MSMQQLLSTWISILPYLQVSLGGWQILKFTPLGGIIQGVIGWLLWPLFPGFFPSYALLRRFPGRVFTTGTGVVPTNPAGLTKAGRPDTSYTDFSPPGDGNDHFPETPSITPSTTPPATVMINTPPRSLLRSPPRPCDHPCDHPLVICPRPCDHPCDYPLVICPRPCDHPCDHDHPCDDHPCDHPCDDDHPCDHPNSNMELDIGDDDHLWYIEGQMTYVRRASVPRPSAHVGFASVPRPSADVRFASVPRPSNATASNTNVEQDRPTTVSMHYLGDDFKLRYDKNELSVNEKMSHYISGIQWARICEMNKKCFKGKRPNKVVFIKGYKDFWEKKGSGNVMTFDEVLDCVIDEKTGVTISRNFDALPVDLSQQSNEIISMLLNLVGLFFQAKNFSWYFPTVFSTVFSIVSAVLEFSPVASWIYGKINMVVCRSLQCIFDKLPYSMRRQVYSLDTWVQNLAPCNDIQFKVVRDTTITVVIGGAAKTNVSLLEEDAIPEPFSIFVNKQTFVCDPPYNSLVIEAEYKDVKNKCIAILKDSKNRKHRRVSVKCNGTDDFNKICTFLKCVAKTKAGSLISYDKNKKKVVVRSWKESVRHYVEAGLPDVYTLTLHDVTM